MVQCADVANAYAPSRLEALDVTVRLHVPARGQAICRYRHRIAAVGLIIAAVGCASALRGTHG